MTNKLTKAQEKRLRKDIEGSILAVLSNEELDNLIMLFESELAIQKKEIVAFVKSGEFWEALTIAKNENRPSNRNN